MIIDTLHNVSYKFIDFRSSSIILSLKVLNFILLIILKILILIISIIIKEKFTFR